MGRWLRKAGDMSNPEDLVQEVAQEFDVSVDDMLGKSRARDLVDARGALAIAHVIRRHNAIMRNDDWLSESYAGSYKRLKSWAMNTQIPDLPRRARKPNVHRFVYVNRDMVAKVRRFASEQRTSTTEAMTYLLNRAFAAIES